ncbi:helix-turn-helix domain-containing protein [uncultured Thiodictyon sp.]|uniref:helix-turn-helix transcriptional regulator n=1 Tax=uncultured Thiodictyon sp. TaxID=1846217 RepID=UPI0025F2BA19|nr:helix-turn-helix domain-containing protein [uncultured Thiodictyon sp.]
MATATATPLKTLRDEVQEAERLSISRRTLQTWRLRGGGPPFVKIGSAVRYDPAQVDAWLDEHTRTNTGPSAGPAPASRARGC